MSITPIQNLLVLNTVGFLGGGFLCYLMKSQNEGLAMICISLACLIAFLKSRVDDLEKQRLEMDEYTNESTDSDVSEDEDSSSDHASSDQVPSDQVPSDQLPSDQVPTNEVLTNEVPPQETPDDNLADDENSDSDEFHYCAEETCGKQISPNAIAGICAGCSLVYYCNRKCQKKDWKAGHKSICNPKLPILHLSPIVSDDEDSVQVVNTVVEPTPVPEPIPVPESIPVPEPTPVPEEVLEAILEPRPPKIKAHLPPMKSSRPSTGFLI
jgi:MYND finger